MAFARRPCAVAVLACAAAFLVAAGGKPERPSMWDRDVVPVYLSPGASPYWVSCYDRSNPEQDTLPPACTLQARQCPRDCRNLCYLDCLTCKLVCSKNTHSTSTFHAAFPLQF
jgi:hypothetical protein